MDSIIEVLKLAGVLKVTKTNIEVRIPLSEGVHIALSVPLATPPSATAKLGTDQKLVFRAVYDLIDEASGFAIAIQDVYDAVLIQLPPPPEGKRDRRAEIIQRALRALHERGFITIHNGKVNLGSAFNGDKEIHWSEM